LFMDLFFFYFMRNMCTLEAPSSHVTYPNTQHLCTPSAQTNNLLPHCLKDSSTNHSFQNNWRTLSRANEVQCTELALMLGRLAILPAQANCQARQTCWKRELLPFHYTQDSACRCIHRGGPV
jgi:hypothetical protein